MIHSLLLGNTFYWHHGSLRFTNPKSETSFIVTPACKPVPPAASFILPLSEATCQTHKPPLWCSILILLVCSLRSSTTPFSNGGKTLRGFRKISRDFEKSTKELIYQTLKSGSKLRQTWIRQSIKYQQAAKKKAGSHCQPKQQWDDTPIRQQCTKPWKDKVKSDLST